MNEHDKIFKEIESIKENAADFIQGTFSPELVKRLDLDSLTLEKTSYLDERLKESFSDLVYSCRYAGTTEITLTLLFEHKSQPERHPHLQLLRYMLSIWEASLKEKPKLLQPVIPIIFYHGRRRWKHRSFTESFAGIDKHLEPFIPCFDYLLTDLSRYDAQAIRETLFKRDANRILMQLLKFIGDERLVDEHFEEIFTPGIGYFNTPEGESFLISILVYIYRTIDLSPESVTKRLAEISYDGGQIAMTTAMRLHEEGKKQGIAEGKELGIAEGKKQGIAEGKKETSRENARRMLAEGLPSEIISRCTGLSESEIKALQDDNQ